MSEHEDPVSALSAAEESLESVESEIESIGTDRVERVAHWHGRFVDLIDRYRERASGSGRETFKAYVAFEGELDDLMGELPDDVLHTDAFEAAESVLDRRRLEEADFDRAREALSPAREVADLIDEREAAVERVRRARAAVERRRRAKEAEIDELAAVLAYEDVDLDAPVDRLRDPIEAYEAAVDDAFDDFLASAAARQVIEFVDTTSAYPLVDFPEPPDGLRRHLRETPAGKQPVPTLLEWAGYTRSKLAHYVEDPAAFRTHVAGNRTFLDRLDAGPLQVDWPPPTANLLRYRARELVSVVERFAPEETVARLHAVRDLARDAEYSRLRRAATARAALSAEERQGLRDGSVHEEIERLREERDRLSRALEAHRDP